MVDPVSLPDSFIDYDNDRRTVESVVPRANNVPYIMAVAFMMALGVVSITVLVAVHPEKDNTAIITTIIGFLTPTTLSLLAFMKAQETHLSVNSRLDAFIANAKAAARAQGRSEGRAQADARTDALKEKQQ